MLCPKRSRRTLKTLQHGICSLAAVEFPSTSFTSVISLETVQLKKYRYSAAFSLSGSINTAAWPAGKHGSMQLTTGIKRVFKIERIVLTLSYDLTTSRRCPTYAKELLKQISQCWIVKSHKQNFSFWDLTITLNYLLHASSLFYDSVEMHLCRRLLSGTQASPKFILSAPFEL